MKRIESPHDLMTGIATYELTNGNRVRFDLDAVQRYGVAALMKNAGLAHLLPTERVKVMQEGRMIGTLPPDFDPSNVRSTSWLYEPRPGDFRREGDAWIANRMLGPGDFEAVAGFRFA